MNGPYFYFQISEKKPYQSLSETELKTTKVDITGKYIYVHFVLIKEYRYGTITILSPMTQLGFEKKQLYFLDASSTLQKNVQNDLLNTKRECWEKKKLLYILGILQFTILQNMGRCAN